MATFEGPAPTTIRIPIRPVRRDDQIVPVDELREDEVYVIRVGLLPLKAALELEGWITRKLATLVPVLKKQKDGQGQGLESLEKLLTADDLEWLGEKLGSVCELYNGVSQTSGTERWIPLNAAGRADHFGGGRMLAYNRWLLEALKVNFADFFDGLGLGMSSKPGDRGLIATVLDRVAPRL